MGDASGTVISGFLAGGWVAELLLHNRRPARAVSAGDGLRRLLCCSLWVFPRNRTLNELPDDVAALGAVAIGEWHEAAMVVFLFSLGNTLQAYHGQTRQSVHSGEATKRRRCDGRDILPMAIRLGT